DLVKRSVVTLGKLLKRLLVEGIAAAPSDRGKRIARPIQPFGENRQTERLLRFHTDRDGLGLSRLSNRDAGCGFETALFCDNRVVSRFDRAEGKGAAVIGGGGRNRFSIGRLQGQFHSGDGTADRVFDASREGC